MKYLHKKGISNTTGGKVKEQQAMRGNLFLSDTGTRQPGYICGK